MSNKVTELCRGLVMSPAAKGCLMCLADSSKDNGEVWHGTSVARVMAWTCHSKRTVLRSLDWLEEQELILVSRPGAGRRNQIRIDLHAIEQRKRCHGDTSSGATEEANRCHGDTSSGASEEANRCHGDTGATVTPVSGCHPTGATVAPELVPGCHHIPYVHIYPSLCEADDMNLKTKTQQLAGELRRAGFPKARATEQLTEIVKLGGSFEDVLAAVRGSEHAAGDPFAYGVTVLLNRMRAAPPSADPSGWENAPRSVVEAKADDLGIGRWDSSREHWPAYKARVTAAAERQAATTA